MIKNGSIMFERKIIIAVLIVCLAGAALGFHFYSSSRGSVNSPNYEIIGTVSRVIDGDTVEVKIEEKVQPVRGVELGMEKVRLACLDTEELSKSEAVDEHGEVENISQAAYEETDYYQKAVEARDLLESFIPEGSKVYLDLDDLAYGEGPYRGCYGRLIAVILVRDNDGWTNVNAKLVEEQYSPDTNSQYPLNFEYNTEFTPHDWLESDYPYLD